MSQNNVNSGSINCLCMCCMYNTLWNSVEGEDPSAPPSPGPLYATLVNLLFYSSHSSSLESDKLSSSDKFGDYCCHFSASTKSVKLAQILINIILRQPWDNGTLYKQIIFFLFSCCLFSMYTHTHTHT